MSDWKSLFNSDEFRAYRKKQAELVAKLIYSNVKNSLSGISREEKIAGQLEMAKNLLKLPESLTQDDKLLENLRRQLEEDIANITTYLIREAFKEE